MTSSQITNVNERDICRLAYAEVVRKNHGNKVAGRSNEPSLVFKQLFLTFQPIPIWRNFEKKISERSLDSCRRSCDRRPTVKQRFFDVSSNSENFCKKSLNGHATVVGGDDTVGRLLTNFFRRFMQIGIIFKEVTERSRDHGRRSRDRRPTVKSNSENLWKKLLNGNAILVGGRATVGRLSTKFFRRFMQFGKFLTKVTNGHLSHLRSRNHQPTVKLLFLTFQAIQKIFEKVAERSRDSGRRSRDRWPTVNNFFSTFQAIRKFFEKSCWTVMRQWSEVTRPSADCHALSVLLLPNRQNIACSYACSL